MAKSPLERIADLKEKRKALDLQIKKLEAKVKEKEQEEANRYYKLVNSEAAKAGVDLTSISPQDLIALIKSKQLDN